MKIVSACLAGIECRWDGRSKPCRKVIELVEQGQAIPVCPDLLGGLSVPRVPMEQRGDKVFTKDGEDVTSCLESGAQRALRLALDAGCDGAILKTKSPSCGSGKIYDGTFSGRLIEGDGVFTKILKKNGIEVITENEV